MLVLSELLEYLCVIPFLVLSLLSSFWVEHLNVLCHALLAESGVNHG
jgi:hypothetical protein